MITQYVCEYCNKIYPDERSANYCEIKDQQAVCKHPNTRLVFVADNLQIMNYCRDCMCYMLVKDIGEFLETEDFLENLINLTHRYEAKPNES